jgi:dihydrolipoamide dehydrogenase
MLVVKNKHIDILVIGSGPGGYAAAFRAADLGERLMLVDKDPTLGGVCLIGVVFLQKHFCT